MWSPWFCLEYLILNKSNSEFYYMTLKDFVRAVSKSRTSSNLSKMEKPVLTAYVRNERSKYTYQLTVGFEMCVHITHC